MKIGISYIFVCYYFAGDQIRLGNIGYRVAQEYSVIAGVRQGEKNSYFQFLSKMRGGGSVLDRQFEGEYQSIILSLDSSTFLDK